MTLVALKDPEREILLNELEWFNDLLELIRKGDLETARDVVMAAKKLIERKLDDRLLQRD